MVGPRPLARPGYLAPADQPPIGHGMVGGATRPGGDDGGAPPGKAGDAVDARGLQRFGETHRWQHSGQPARQPRLPCPKGTAQEQMMGSTPASSSASHASLGWWPL
jgi:hypothetical protein